MQNTYIYAVTAIYVVVTIANAIWSLIIEGKEKDVKAREKIVSQRECNCDRRAEIIDSAERMIDERFSEAHRWADDAVMFSASYTVTDSDEIKYSNEEDVLDAAKDRIAHNIALDIVHRFVPKEEKTQFGRTKFSYHFRVVEEKL